MVHLWCHGMQCVRYARGWHAYGVRTVPGAPVPLVDTARRWLVRLAHTYSTEALGCTFQRRRAQQRATDYLPGARHQGPAVGVELVRVGVRVGVRVRVRV